MARKLTFIMLVCSHLALSQIYTLEQCIEEAVANNPDVQTSKLNIDRAKNQTSINNSRKLPQFAANIYQGGNFGRSIDRFTNDYIDQFYNSTYAALQFNLPLFNGFQNKWNLASSLKSEQSAQEELKATKNRITRTTIGLYMAQQTSLDLLEIAEKQKTNTLTQIENLKKKIEAGIKTNIDLVQLENQLNNDELGILDAYSNVNSSKLALFQAMNKSFDTNVTFAKLNSIGLALNIAEKPINEIVEQQAEARQFKFGSESIDFDIKAAGSSLMPRVSLSGDYGLFYASTNKERGFTQQLNDTRNGAINIGLRIPIAAGLQNKPLIQAQKIQKAYLTNSYHKTQQILRAEIERTTNEYKIAKNRLAKSQELVAKAETAYSFIERQFNSGTVSIESLLLAKNTLERAQINLTISKNRLLQEFKILDYFYKQ